MNIDILTLFPDMFVEVFNKSIIGRAIEEEKVSINYTDIREFSKNKHKKVDDYPFGGGKGMLMQAEPIYDAINSIRSKDSRVIYLSPKGKKLNQEKAVALSKEKHLVLICGHYEGIDDRIVENYIDEEVSIGDYVLTGGEIASMVIVDAVVRLLPGVLRDEESFKIESHYEGLLEYPQYTRPRKFRGIEVPEVLLSGDHKKIEEWRLYESLKSTYQKRPELLENKELTYQEKHFLNNIKKELK